MARITSIIKELLGNAIYLKVSYLLLICFYTISFLMPLLDGLLKVVLIYGFLYLVYDLFTRRLFFKAPFVKFLLVFLALYAVTVAINYQKYLWDNFVALCYMAVSMLILFPHDPQEDHEKKKRELLLICRLISWILFATTVLSLLVYLLDINMILYYFGKPVYIGVHQNRLWGIYPNPNTSAVLAGLGIAASMLVWLLKRRSKKQTVLFCINFSCQMLLIVLSGSRGGELFLFALFGVILFFFRDKIAARFTKKHWQDAKKYLVSVICFLVFVGSYYALSTPIKNAVALVPYGVSMITQSGHDQGLEEFQPLGREENADTSVDSGRLRLWKISLQRFAQHPVFGMTAKGLTDGVITDGAQTEHMHNLYIQILGSSGILGFLTFMVFKTWILLRAMLYAFREKQRDRHYDMMIVLFAVAAATAVQQLVEVDELYRVEATPVITWILLGYLVCFLPKKSMAGVEACENAGVD